jgi:hypothetical protein
MTDSMWLLLLLVPPVAGIFACIGYFLGHREGQIRADGYWRHKRDQGNWE